MGGGGGRVQSKHRIRTQTTVHALRNTLKGTGILGITSFTSSSIWYMHKLCIIHFHPKILPHLQESEFQILEKTGE